MTAPITIHHHTPDSVSVECGGGHYFGSSVADALYKALIGTNKNLHLRAYTSRNVALADYLESALADALTVEVEELGPRVWVAKSNAGEKAEGVSKKDALDYFDHQNRTRVAALEAEMFFHVSLQWKIDQYRKTEGIE